MGDPWAALAEHRRASRDSSLRELFRADPGRAARYSLQAGDLFIDYSKHLITDETLHLLLDLAAAADVAGLRDAMFAGERINVTEDRAVLHTALRAAPGTVVRTGGRDVVADVHATLDRMSAFAARVRAGDRAGHSGRPFRNVVQLGIGGSILGPAMAREALRPWGTRELRFRFVSDLDGADLHEALRGLDPAETLFIIASKSLGTVETMTNARAARAWLGGGPERVAAHFAAVSTNAAAARDFGMEAGSVFPLWDWVGGRYSCGSSIGLALMIAIGPDRFRDFLAGFRLIDEHFRDAPPAGNAPLLLGLLGVWYREFFAAQSHVVLPYSHHLRRFPEYLQQLDMESNGKSVDRAGRRVARQTGPIVWGGPGVGGQHAFFQLLHQGTVVVPADFIGFARPAPGIPEAQHNRLMANFLAQPRALAFGRTAGELRAEGVPEALMTHRLCPGNRPSTAILASRLTPSVLGQLIALYEHKVFVQGAVWGLNSFDQWGVELGKILARDIEPALTRAGDLGETDSSTAALVARYHDLRDEPKPS